MNKYVAWQDEATKAAFFNPIGMLPVAVGDSINGCVAVAIGTLDEMTAEIESLSRALPDLPSFEDMLTGV